MPFPAAGLLAASVPTLIHGRTAGLVILIISETSSTVRNAKDSDRFSTGRRASANRGAQILTQWTNLIANDFEEQLSKGVQAHAVVACDK